MDHIMALMQVHMPLFECRAHGPDDIMDAYLLHAISHISASAARIKKNNDALKAGQDPEACRDQGFTRAKVRAAQRLALLLRGVLSHVCFNPPPFLCLQILHRLHASLEGVDKTLACCGIL